MVEYLRAKAAAQGIQNMRIALMDGQALDVEDNSFDTAISILGLRMFPDRAAGFRELCRAIKPGGRAGFLSSLQAPTMDIAGGSQCV